MDLHAPNTNENLMETNLQYINKDANLSQDELVLLVLMDQYSQPIFGFLITKHLLPIIFIIGTFGNLLSVAVLWRHGLKKSSTVFYLFVLSIADLVSSFVGMPFLYLADVFHIAPRDHSNFFCKVQTFLTYASTHFIAWLLVAVTVDRVMWVTLGLKARKLCTTRRAIVVTSLIIVLVCLANSHFLFTLETVYIKEDATTACIALEQYEEFAIKVVPWIDIITLSFFPFTIMTICNIIIIWKLNQMAKIRDRMKGLRSYQRRKKGLNQNSQKGFETYTKNRKISSIAQAEHISRGASNKEKSLTMMLLTINIFFIISTLPITLLNTVWELAADRLTDSHKMIINQFQSIGSFLLYLNITFHFLLFIFSGKIFRNEFAKMLESISCLSKCTNNSCFRWILSASKSNSPQPTQPRNENPSKSQNTQSVTFAKDSKSHDSSRKVSMFQVKFSMTSETTFNETDIPTLLQSNRNLMVTDL